MTEFRYLVYRRNVSSGSAARRIETRLGIRIGPKAYLQVGGAKVIAKPEPLTRNTVREARSVVRALEGEIGDFSSNHDHRQFPTLREFSRE